MPCEIVEDLVIYIYIYIDCEGLVVVEDVVANEYLLTCQDLMTVNDLVTDVLI